MQEGIFEKYICCAGTRIRTWVAVKATVLQTVAIVHSAIPAITFHYIGIE